MADSGGIKVIVNQVAMQATTTVVMAYRDVDTRTQPISTASQREPQRQRHKRLVIGRLHSVGTLRTDMVS